MIGRWLSAPANSGPANLIACRRKQVERRVPARWVFRAQVFDHSIVVFHESELNLAGDRVLVVALIPDDRAPVGVAKEILRSKVSRTRCRRLVAHQELLPREVIKAGLSVWAVAVKAVQVKPRGSNVRRHHGFAAAFSSTTYAIRRMIYLLHSGRPHTNGELTAKRTPASPYPYPVGRCPIGVTSCRHAQAVGFWQASGRPTQRANHRPSTTVNAP